MSADSGDFDPTDYDGVGVPVVVVEPDVPTTPEPKRVQRLKEIQAAHEGRERGAMRAEDATVEQMLQMAAREAELTAMIE